MKFMESSYRISNSQNTLEFSKISNAAKIQKSALNFQKFQSTKPPSLQVHQSSNTKRYKLQDFPKPSYTANTANPIFQLHYCYRTGIKKFKRAKKKKTHETKKKMKKIRKEKFESRDVNFLFFTSRLASDIKIALYVTYVYIHD